jgi:hypothetical protein
MTKHTQILLHDPANGVIGDCWRTCVACLLDVEPETVPHFILKPSWYEDTLAWLRERGYGLYEFGGLFEQVSHTGLVGCHHIITGGSPRDPVNVKHAVIGLDEEVVWDPHPSRAGIVGEPHGWYHAILVKL